MAGVGLSVSVGFLVLWKAIQSLGSQKAPQLLDNRICCFDVHKSYVNRFLLCSHWYDVVFDK
jgi:hypothetical protein